MTEIESINCKREKRGKYRDKIRGCLFGGAAGDALGYPVEFFSAAQIKAQYGRDGITSYRYAPDGTALISDDTQMSLFTANGVLIGDTRGSLRGIAAAPSSYVAMAYNDWLTTQTVSFDGFKKRRDDGQTDSICWLMEVPRLFALRAPGNTCLGALTEARSAGSSSDFIADHRNDSKGCGGIMRIAPFSLFRYFPDLKRADREAAQIAAITHGHSLGFMPAAVLSHVINRLVYSGGTMTLKQAVTEARDTASEIFAGDKHLKQLCDMIDLSVSLSENDEGDPANIARIGEGWVAEETLGIAIYCSLRHENDFSGGITAAVNHDGDSDSTGAVTGNILGAICGYDAIEDKWKERLELSDVILEIADDLTYGCLMSEYGEYEDPVWVEKYVYGRLKS